MTTKLTSVGQLAVTHGRPMVISVGSFNRFINHECRHRMGHPEIVLLSIKWVNLRFERIDSRWGRFRLKKFKILKLNSPQNLRLLYKVSKIMKILKFRSTEADLNAQIRPPQNDVVSRARAIMRAPIKVIIKQHRFTKKLACRKYWHLVHQDLRMVFYNRKVHQTIRRHLDMWLLLLLYLQRQLWAVFHFYIWVHKSSQRPGRMTVCSNHDILSICRFYLLWCRDNMLGLRHTLRHHTRFLR